jgi:hypothetical protein
MAGTPRERMAGAFDRLSTSYKLLILLSLSLLPIMLIALLASFQASRNSIERHREEYSALAADEAGKIGATFAVDQRLLTNAIAALDRGTSPGFVCQELAQVTGYRRVVRPFALFAADGTLLCETPNSKLRRPDFSPAQAAARVTVTTDRLLVTVPSRTGAVGVIGYDRAVIGELDGTLLRAPGIYDLTIEQGEAAMNIVGPHDRPLTSMVVSAPVRGGLVLKLTISAPGTSASEWLLALLPILMWAAAAIVGFLVVDRALLRPLEELRARIAGAHGAIPEFPAIRTPAHEIRDLAEALTGYAEERGTHESAIGEALNRQTALTREVHHRVKNNLQVIASLISLHARATTDPPALEAFSAIQRRVDALAIVHRNHYAQSDQQGALELKPVLSELTANLMTNLGGTRINVQLENIRVTLDTATALTFLLTEFVELSTLVERSATILLVIKMVDGTGRMTVDSRSFITNETLDELVERRYGRIMNGLVRQLRTTLEHDPVRGGYIVEFPILPRD